jgi:hypothetical protein
MSTAEATATRPARINVQQHGAGGLMWFAAWLFTIGVLQLTFWQGAAALFIWPYYLGLRIAVWLAAGHAV